MRSHLRGFAYLLSLALLAAGCVGRSANDITVNSNAHAGTEEKKLARASEVVTPADAQRVLRVPVRLDDDEYLENKSSCFYLGLNYEGGDPSRLSVNLLKARTEELAKSSFEAASVQGRKSGSGQQVQQLTDLGDEALLVSASPAILSIYVRKKRTVFFLTAVGNDNTAPSVDEIKGLARRAVEQL
jgi:hypothetical protein